MRCEYCGSINVGECESNIPGLNCRNIMKCGCCNEIKTRDGTLIIRGKI